MDPINWHSFFFLLFALVACWCALAVVVSGNIVRMAFYLVISLGAVAGLFFLAGADFVAAMQLMIYVGGTMVLLVFGVMLTARGPLLAVKTNSGQWILAALVGGSLLAVLLWAAFSIDDRTGRRQQAVGSRQWATVGGDSVGDAPKTAARLGLGLLGVRVDRHEQEDELVQKGMSGYLLGFEIVSVHLVVVLIGAAYLARAKRRVAKSTIAPNHALGARPNSGR